MTKGKFFTTLLFIAAATFACGTGGSEKAAAAAEAETATVEPSVDEKKTIEDYVKTKNLKGFFTPSGLFVSVKDSGSGKAFPLASSIVKAEYTGYTLDGKVFDASQPGQPIEFGLNQVIPGWTEGMQLLKKGGKATLVIPSVLAYGPTGKGPIAPNTILAFDVTLVDWK